MKTQSHFKLWTRLALAAYFVLGLSLEAHAASATWTGTDANGLWNDNANWGGSVSPGSVAMTGTVDVATFGTGGAAVTSLGQNISLGEIITGASGNNVSITDASHSLTISGVSGTGISMGGDSLTLNVNTTFANNTAVAVSNGILTFGSGSTLSISSKTITFSGSNGTVNIDGSVSSTSGSLVNQGLTMNLVSSGSPANIKFGSASAAKTGSLNITTSGISNSSAISLIAQTSGSGTSNFTIGVGVAGGGTGTYTGVLTLTNGTSGADNIILNAASGNTLTYAGQISGTNTSALSIQGTGTVVFTGATNNYTSPTSVTNGATLEFTKTTAMSATSTVTTANGGTLVVAVGGAGQFTTTGTGTGTLAGIFSGIGGQTGSVVSFASGATVGIDTGSNSVSYGTAIPNAGPNTIGVLKLGSGALTLSAASTYTGTTTVSAGTLVLGNGSGTVSTTAANNTNGSATGTGALVVNPGATLAGMGTAAVSSFNISGTSSANKALVLVGQTSTSDTNTSGALTLLGGTSAGNSTIANANLAFNLDQSSVGVGNTLNVGATGITFGASVTLALNLQNLGVVPANSSYTLIAGTGVTTISGGLTSGQYGGLQTFVNSQGLTEILNSGNGQAGNLALSLSGLASTWYGNGSYLYLSQSSGVDDIDVEVVPEPGTWAMMLGGLAVLIFWQRRRSVRA